MCKIILNNKNLYEEKIKNILLDLVEHEKIKDVKIYLSKILKKIIKNDKMLLYKDETLHKICFLLNKENIPCINNIFKDVTIRYNIINEGNNNNNIENNNDNINNDKKTEKYFKGDNEFFIKEFKIELEKKTSIYFLDKNSSNNNKSNNILINTNTNDLNNNNENNDKEEDKKENDINNIEDKK